MIPRLVDLEVLARQAGAILLEGYGKRHDIDYKGAIDLVTEIDHRSEAFLLGEIHRLFPGHRILSEESGNHGSDDRYLWLVDPLDGTVNYAHGVPLFTVSIAFIEHKQIRLGVIYDPIHEECFSAEQDSGAWLNGAAIRVSDTPDLNHSLLVTGFSYDVRHIPPPYNNLDFYTRFALLTQGVRRLGTAALDLSYVACGRLDGYWEMKLAPWDIAAGALIAEEAGAKVTSVFGDGDYLTQNPSILAANPVIHASMLKVLLDGLNDN
jgi:myo-inositol-1(or 4)-monophosphatase